MDFEKLCAELEAARTQHASDQMAGSLAALVAVSDFLRAQGATPGQMLPISWLLHYLTDASPGKPVFEIGRWSIATAAVDLLMETGAPLDQACRDVAMQTNGTLSAKQIKDWRKNLNAGRSKPGAQEYCISVKNALRAKLAEMMPEGKQLAWKRPILATVSDAFGKQKV